MRPNQTDNRPEYQVANVMYELVQNGRRFPHPGPLWDGPIYPGQGYPPSPGQDRPGLSPFGRLAKEQPLGKKTVLLYDADTNAEQPAGVSILRVEGDNLDATQMVITIAPPSVIPLDFIEATGLDYGLQNATGEQDNQQIGDGNFPGDVAPIAWPPLEAVIEWGVGGTSSKMIVDITNGCTVPVVASYVNVHAVVTQSEESGEISGTSALYVIAAWIGPGLSKGPNAKRTVYVGTVGLNAESAVFAVPAFARRCYLVGCSTAATPDTTVGVIRFWQSPDGAAGTTNVGNFLVSANQPQAFDIPNGAAYFSVFNQAPEMKLSVIFELDC